MWSPFQDIGTGGYRLSRLPLKAGSGSGCPAAGRATDEFSQQLSFRPIPKTTASIDDLQSLAGRLRHYPAIHRSVQSLLPLLRYLASGQGTGNDHIEFSKTAESQCDRVIAACNETLGYTGTPPPKLPEDLPPSTAAGKSPPTSPGSSGSGQLP